MSHDGQWTTTAVRAIFADEVEAAGGNVTDVYQDATRLFARSVLPELHEVLPGDQFRAGVALRAAGTSVWVHPYVFRQVCRNGAIRAHAIETRQIDGLDHLEPAEAEAAVREAVRSCCTAEAFAGAAAEVRSAREVEADMYLSMMSLVARLPRDLASRVLSDVVDRFVKGPDTSRFGLMNAVTAAARETADPDLRWRLEEFGGAIPVNAPTPPRSGGGRVSRPVRVMQWVS